MPKSISEDSYDMGLNYDRIRKQRDEHSSFWTSYSDLFLMLSIVFLLLYVVATLRSGTFGVQKNTEYQRLSREAQDLKEQIRVYSTLRDEQLAKTSGSEQQVYANLIDKLKLLKEEAKTEKESLRKQATENEQKEIALNEYQQIIRNIIDANVLAKGQIQRRDRMLVTKENVIEKQSAEIKRKASVIAENNNKIARAQSDLTANIRQLELQQQKAKSSKASLESAIANLKEKSNTEITQLRKQSEEERIALNSEIKDTKATYRAQMDALKAESRKNLAAERAQFDRDLKKHKLSAAERERREAAFRHKAEGEAHALQGKLAGLAATAAETEAALESATADKSRAEGEARALKGQVSGLKGETKDLKGQLTGLSAQAEEANRALQSASAGKSRAEGEARALKGKVSGLEGETKNLKGQLTGLSAQAEETNRALQSASAEKSRALATVQDLKKSNAEISAEMKHVKEIADAKKNLAAAIRRNFGKAGIQAAVDETTGDVTLAFPDDYFEAGQASLKPGMENRLKKFIPAYTQSLFSDPRSADKIANVEIIGFASPTYKGRYVNPQSLKDEDREAVDYNLRLSFSRANSIFKYIFDRRELSYTHQEKLLPLVKVVGRGYLPDGKAGSEIPSGTKEKEFCKLYNCKRAQKVVVKFNLKD